MLRDSQRNRDAKKQTVAERVDKGSVCTKFLAHNFLLVHCKTRERGTTSGGQMAFLGAMDMTELISVARDVEHDLVGVRTSYNSGRPEYDTYNQYHPVNYGQQSGKSDHNSFPRTNNGNRRLLLWPRRTYRTLLSIRRTV